MKNLGIDNESFLNFMDGLEIDLPNTDNKIETYQYTTRSFLCNSDIKKIPFVVTTYTNKISNFITEIIFITSQELTESTKKRYGLRRSYKL